MSDFQEKIVSVLIEEEMRHSYIDYSMSVIVSRALPDVRDGLKPVHRRVLFGMLELGLRPNSSYKKSARIVGEVLGKYHPHGDTAVYDTMVRMVQSFSLRYPLVDGQGNFGSIDGDAPAAMRYTEAKLNPIAEEVLRDLDKDTVDFVPNFDESLKEPSVLPSLLPTLLANGASGIAVGMATNIPPHNLNEVVDALSALIDQPNLKPLDIKKYLKGPDFPTGAIISGEEEIDAYFKTGRGKLTVRARVHIEDVSGGRQRIVVDEIPYQVNKTSLIERIAELVRNKKIEGIYDIRDESDKEGMRVVFELRKESETESILRDLFKYSQMQTTFGVILLALVNGQPRVLNIKEMLTEFLEFRHKVVLRRTKYELEKAEKRAHILEGLKIALDNINEIISVIRKSRDVDTARKNLIKRFQLSEIQAQAILDMRLQRLTGLERKKIEAEYLELIKLIEKLKSLLKSKDLRMQLVKKELLSLKENYGDQRKTQILSKTGKTTLKDMISEEKFIIAVSLNGFVTRFAVNDFDFIKDELRREISKDCVRFLIESSNSHHIVFINESGKGYVVRTSYLPLANEQAIVASLSRLLHSKKEDRFVYAYNVEKFEENRFVFIATRNGLVKKVTLSDFSKIKPDGRIVIGLKEDDKVVAAEITDGTREVIIATANGKCIRFSETDARDMGLAAGGIKGIELEQGDYVTGMAVLKETDSYMLSITNCGFGKRSDLKEYSTIRRGGKGIVNYKVTDKVGHIVNILEVTGNEQFFIFTKKGKQKRLKVKDIKIMGRATQGMAVLIVKQGDEITDIFRS